MVVYFSGTGNSRVVAEAIASEFADQLVELAGKTIIAPEKTALDLHEGNKELCIWVFPVYSWGVPPVVVNFIKKCNIPGGENAAHHLIVTCGDDAGLTARQWRKLIGARGWVAGSATSVIMPNTYVLMKGFDTDPVNVADEKLSKAPAEVRTAIERIKAGATDDHITQGRFAWIKSRIIYPWFKRYAMTPKPFHFTDRCISCGKCAASCPMLNIAMNADKRPEWGSDCALCLRCYHVCPVHAVAYGKATQGKGQYLCKKRLNQTKPKEFNTTK